MKYVDPTGELLELTGSESDQAAAFERIKRLLGKDAAKLLYLRTEKGHTYVDYNGSRGEDPHSVNALIAATDSGIGAFVQKVIDDKANVVEFRVATEFDTKEGHYTTAGFGGAATVGKEESLTHNTQIFVSPSAGNITFEKFGDTNFGRMASNNGNILEFTNDIDDGHEFAHAIANVYEGKSLKGHDSDSRALQLENYIRARNGLRTMRVRHF